MSKRKDDREREQPKGLFYFEQIDILLIVAIIAVVGTIIIMIASAIPHDGYWPKNFAEIIDIVYTLALIIGGAVTLIFAAARLNDGAKQTFLAHGDADRRNAETQLKEREQYEVRFDRAVELMKEDDVDLQILAAERMTSISLRYPEDFAVSSVRLINTLIRDFDQSIGRRGEEDIATQQMRTLISCFGELMRLEHKYELIFSWDMSEIDLSYCSFQNLCIHSNCFANCRFEGAMFHDCEFEGDFSGDWIELPEGEPCNSKSFKGSYFSNCDFYMASFWNVNFGDTVIYGKFGGGNWCSCNFQAARVLPLEIADVCESNPNTTSDKWNFLSEEFTEKLIVEARGAFTSCNLTDCIFEGLGEVGNERRKGDMMWRNYFRPKDFVDCWITNIDKAPRGLGTPNNPLQASYRKKEGSNIYIDISSFDGEPFDARVRDFVGVPPEIFDEHNARATEPLEEG